MTKNLAGWEFKFKPDRKSLWKPLPKKSKKKNSWSNAKKDWFGLRGLDAREQLGTNLKKLEINFEQMGAYTRAFYIFSIWEHIWKERMETMCGNFWELLGTILTQFSTALNVWELLGTFWNNFE